MSFRLKFQLLETYFHDTRTPKMMQGAENWIIAS